MNEEELLLNRLRDLQLRAERSGSYTYSNFLSLPEQDLFLKNVREYGFRNFSLEGGTESAERRLVVFGPEDPPEHPPDLPVSVLEIRPLQEKYGEELSHRDILGAVMSLQIDRSLTGDILVRGKTAYLFCLDRIADFLCENLTKIRRTDVRCSRSSADPADYQPVLQELSLNIASERLDSIAAALTGISRSHIGRLFSEKRVFLNGRLTESLSARPREGDIITIRGFGKAVYDGISGASRKGRLYVKLRKYV